jgi:hypothetical protein
MVRPDATQALRATAARGLADQQRRARRDAVAGLQMRRTIASCSSLSVGLRWPHREVDRGPAPPGSSGSHADEQSLDSSMSGVVHRWSVGMVRAVRRPV